ncbi:hypothetical protein BJY04DRAFT_204207 [Aspergillus karnatakaensis]|uniref:uncharacterized protein n=1 Tax=Aspergillus karnatakaensis TaxID=1810916 RepID=UPI003CCDA050
MICLLLGKMRASWGLSLFTKIDEARIVHLQLQLLSIDRRTRVCSQRLKAKRSPPQPQFNLTRRLLPAQPVGAPVGQVAVMTADSPSRNRTSHHSGNTSETFLLVAAFCMDGLVCLISRPLFLSLSLFLLSERLVILGTSRTLAGLGLGFSLLCSIPVQALEKRNALSQPASPSQLPPLLCSMSENKETKLCWVQFFSSLPIAFHLKGLDFVQNGPMA